MSSDLWGKIFMLSNVHVINETKGKKNSLSNLLKYKTCRSKELIYSHISKMKTSRKYQKQPENKKNYI